MTHRTRDWGLGIRDRIDRAYQMFRIIPNPDSLIPNP
jgi:hypothetical protein